MTIFFSSKYASMSSIVIVVGIFCTNGMCPLDNQTSALTNTVIQEKISSHETAPMSASNCNSANRFEFFQSGPAVRLNDKLTLLEEASATMDAAKKQALSTKLQSYGGQLQPLDQNLNNQWCHLFSLRISGCIDQAELFITKTQISGC